jgi:hypothetical protein
MTKKKITPSKYQRSLLHQFDDPVRGAVTQGSLPMPSPNPDLAALVVT